MCQFQMRFSVSVFCALLLCTCAIGADSSWQLPAGTVGSWHDAANWTAGVPTSGALIDNGGTASIDSAVAGTGWVHIGDRGAGTISQSAGTFRPSSMRIGLYAGSDGVLRVSGGSLYSVQDFGVGEMGHGLVEQTGGSVGVWYPLIGGSNGGVGVYRVSGGTFATSQLTLGKYAGSTGRLEISGNAYVRTGVLRASGNGSSLIVQDGGDCEIVDELSIVGGTVSNGYELSGGTLRGKQINLTTQYSFQTGRFAQSGGTMAVSRFDGGAGSLYQLSGGAIFSSASLAGRVDFMDSAGTVNLGGGGMLNLSRATLQRYGNIHLTVAPNSLLVLPAGMDSTAFGGFSCAGVTHVPGAQTTIPADQTITAYGPLDGYIRCQGTLKVPTVLGSGLSITGGVSVPAGAYMDVGGTGSSFHEPLGSVCTDGSVSENRGTIKAGAMTIGLGGTGQFVQSQGTTSVDEKVTLGQLAGASGTLSVSDGLFQANMIRAGYGGTGFIHQTGGTVKVTNPEQYSGDYGMYLGADVGTGIYQLDGGLLSAAKTIAVGSFRTGTGHLVQTGGTLEAGNRLGIGDLGTYVLSGGIAKAGYAGAGAGGWVRQTGGTLETTSGLGIGGRYELSGDSLLKSTGLLGLGGSTGGTFSQNGGTVSVDQKLLVASEPGDRGRYDLHSGVVSAAQTWVGWAASPWFGQPLSGVMQQDGGVLTTNQLQVGVNGQYNITGGSLSIAQLWRQEGVIDLGGRNVTVELGSGALADFRTGQFLNAGGGSLHAGPKSLILLPTGGMPAGFFGTVASEGLVHSAGTDLEIPAGYSFSLGGTLSDYAIVGGSLAAPASDSLQLRGGVYVQGTGAVNLGGGELFVTDNRSGMSGGRLTVNYTNVQGTDGRFVQTGGSHVVAWDMRVGTSAGTRGTYEMAGAGVATAYNLLVGSNGEGSFAQQAGRVQVSQAEVGKEAGKGTYEMWGGSFLASGRTTIGGMSGYYGWGGTGDGHWIQHGGTSTHNLLGVSGWGQGSSLEMSGGKLVSQALSVNSIAGQAVVEHSGGMIDLRGPSDDWSYNLQLGVHGGQIGKYNLSGSGFLQTRTAYIGQDGEGYFTQTGGAALVQGPLMLASWGTSTGRWDMQGGVLSAVTGTVGFRGVGQVVQTGGTISLGRMSIGQERNWDSSRAKGTYEIRGGTTTVTYNVDAGGAGDGLLIQSGGGLNVAGTVSVAPRDGASGKVSLSGGSFRAASLELVQDELSSAVLEIVGNGAAINVGSYSQSGPAVLQCRIGTDGISTINADSATLGGILSVSASGETKPGWYTLLKATHLNGTFLQVQLPADMWRYYQTDTTIMVKYVPEPATATLLLVGLVGLWRRRRRQHAPSSLDSP